jgi:hypothetical protein
MKTSNETTHTNAEMSKNKISEEFSSYTEKIISQKKNYPLGEQNKKNAK